METVRNILAYRPDPAVYGSLRMRALRALALLLALMACFTVVSRAADKMTLATVTTATPTRTALTHSTKVDGSVEPMDKVRVMAPKDALVDEVLVDEGDEVEENQLLMTYNFTELQRQLSQKQLELQKLQLQAQDLAAESAYKADQREQEQEDIDRKVQRAEEDAQLAIEQAQLKVSNATAAREQARRELRAYDGDDEAEERALRNALQNAERAVEQAILEQMEALTAAQRAIDDAADVDDAGYQSPLTAQQLAVDIQLAQMEIAWLQQSIDGSGEVRAPRGGLVEAVDCAPGRSTTGEPVFTLSVTEGLRFAAVLDEDEKKLLDEGASLSLTASGMDRLSGLSARSALPVSGDDGKFRLLIELPEEAEYAPYQSVTLELARRTETHGTCVPLSALYHEGGNSYYLLVLDEGETAMGAELVVRRVEVTVADRNETYAAVTGALNSSDRVVVTADKALRDGDRVRLSE